MNPQNEAVSHIMVLLMFAEIEFAVKDCEESSYVYLVQNIMYNTVFS
jgi:hypothetical protein